MTRSWSMARAARWHGGDERVGMAEGLLAAADELKLTDAQRTQLKEIRRKGPSALMPKRQAVMEAQMDYRDLLAQGNASVTDLRRAHDALQKARNELQDAAFDLRMQAREVLTPEQRDQLRDTMKSKLRRRAPGRMGEAEGGLFDLGDAELDDVTPDGAP